MAGLAFAARLGYSIARTPNRGGGDMPMATSNQTTVNAKLSDAEAAEQRNQGHGEIPITAADEHGEISGWANTDILVEPTNKAATTAKGSEVRANAPETAVLVDEKGKRQPS